MLKAVRSCQGPVRLFSSTGTPPRIIFSGIQPTGTPHLGNYLGALSQWVKLQNQAPPDTTLLYSLVDLHAITVKQDASLLRQWKKEMLASLLAIGLDPKRSIIFHQSDVAAHAELMWILSCNASMGYLSRMTQWKDKSKLSDDSAPLSLPKNTTLRLGLFSYPVLQAADVLVYRATHVPVGQDQAQHLEFARECATGFNYLYGDVLVPPTTILSPARKIQSLTQPLQKMSKSHPNPKSRILLTDSKQEIHSKIRTALTDSVAGISYDPINRPGVSNLLEILCHVAEDAVGPAATCNALADEYKDMSLRAFKEMVADRINDRLDPIRERFRQVMSHNHGAQLDQIAQEGAARASERANVTLSEVKCAIGLS